jgi:hypothetical protein
MAMTTSHQRSILKIKIPEEVLIKGIFQPFELGGERRLIQCAVKY